MLLRILNIVTVGIIAVLAFGSCAEEKLHLSVPTCKRNATDYSTCLRNAINEAWPLFAKGLPAEFGLPLIEPYFYSYYEGAFDSGDLHAKLRGINNTIEGLGNSHFKTVRPHFIDDTFRLEINIRVPIISVHGILEGNGSVAGFRIGGKSNYNLTVENVRFSWDISGPVKNDTWIIEHFYINVFFKKFKMYLDNFFEGNREINDLAMMFVNEYWPQLFRLIIPQASKYWDTYYSNLLTLFFAKLSFSEVFP